MFTFAIHSSLLSSSWDAIFTLVICTQTPLHYASASSVRIWEILTFVNILFVVPSSEQVFFRYNNDAIFFIRTTLKVAYSEIKWFDEKIISSIFELHWRWRIFTYNFTFVLSKFYTEQILHENCSEINYDPWHEALITKEHTVSK